VEPADPVAVAFRDERAVRRARRRLGPQACRRPEPLEPLLTDPALERRLGALH
jgi:hypothetical protein